MSSLKQASKCSALGPVSRADASDANVYFFLELVPLLVNSPFSHCILFFQGPSVGGLSSVVMGKLVYTPTLSSFVSSGIGQALAFVLCLACLVLFGWYLGCRCISDCLECMEYRCMIP